MSRPTVELDAVINAAPTIVFAVLADWRQNVLWEQELLTYSPLTDEPIGVGSRYRWERQIGQRRISGESVLTSYHPGRLFVTEVPTGPIRFRSVITLAPAADGAGTAALVELTQQPRGLLRLLAVPMARALRKRATDNFRALKELAEHQAEEARRPTEAPQPGTVTLP